MDGRLWAEPNPTVRDLRDGRIVASGGTGRDGRIALNVAVRVDGDGRYEGVVTHNTLTGELK